MNDPTTNQYIRQVLHHTGTPPAIQARFFYISPLPIDDPLSPVPPPSSASVPDAQHPTPFSEYDNRALDRAWLELRQKLLQYNEDVGEKAGPRERSGSRNLSTSAGKRRGSSPRADSSRSRVRPAASSLSHIEGRPEELGNGDDVVFDGINTPQSATEISAMPDTTGTPFIRAPSRKKVPTLQPKAEERPTRPRFQAHDTYLWDDRSHLADSRSPPPKKMENDSPTTKVAVGISRLHQVEMPQLQMTPIYWQPVHDTAAVLRATWFYQDTMLPVETHVANMLEAGYVDLQVWTETWKDELDSAVDVGAAGEMKIVHPLWPAKTVKPLDSRPTSSMGTMTSQNLARAAASMSLAGIDPDTPEGVREAALEIACDIIDISTGEGEHDNKASGKVPSGRNYANCGVIYANDREARILKPSLLPSSYYGRRPLANYIRKGHKIGIPVLRGFDQAVWNKLHPSKSSSKATKAEQGVASSASGAPLGKRSKDDPDLALAERPQVSDLVLVIHGIGQKLSRRMESWHFTHAMNAFRREVNVEVGTKDVKTRFRDGMKSIMVLPVNWRESLAFDEGGYTDGPDDGRGFGLEDITPDTLPSVRSLVSDVMLDVPYYMSHHQPKMIAGVIREANRVYQLWCLNNPGFAQHGRVNIIAHSLGSVMSIDILSRQPTQIPAHLSDPSTLEPETMAGLDHFLFNTSNLFLAGSPAGFFLLLKKAQLLPRVDQPSVSADEDPTSNNLSVCGERGTYGCIAVENVYNIVNGYDPVAYRMNAAVDSVYAASLKKAVIPSASASWFRNNSTTSSTSTSWFAGAGLSSNQPPPLPRLPSNVELETHNFTREEVAEKRMRLLNDNGQIDFFLRYGGGPLEIQYLTMLSAHSSYWLLKDFARMIVLEVGRVGGKDGTLTGMRAIKKLTRGTK